MKTVMYFWLWHPAYWFPLWAVKLWDPFTRGTPFVFDQQRHSAQLSVLQCDHLANKINSGTWQECLESSQAKLGCFASIFAYWLWTWGQWDEQWAVSFHTSKNTKNKTSCPPFKFANLNPCKPVTFNKVVKFYPCKLNEFTVLLSCITIKF